MLHLVDRLVGRSGASCRLRLRLVSMGMFRRRLVWVWLVGLVLVLQWRRTRRVRCRRKRSGGFSSLIIVRRYELSVGFLLFIFFFSTLFLFLCLFNYCCLHHGLLMFKILISARFFFSFIAILSFCLCFFSVQFLDSFNSFLSTFHHQVRLLLMVKITCIL